MSAIQKLFSQPTRNLLILILLSYPMVSSAQNNQKHVIGAWRAGFFSAFLGVLNHLNWCEKNNKTPVVYWTTTSLYYNEHGFNGKTNVWEYYFEPVSSLSYENGDTIYSHYAAPGTVAIEGNHNQVDFLCGKLAPETRNVAYYLINKYIKPNPIVQSKIDRFYFQHMHNKKTIGIHLRATDKKLENHQHDWSFPEKLVKVALEHADPDAQFLLASDDQKLFEKMIQLLEGREVIYYDCFRSDDNSALHFQYRKPETSQLGEDVLIESLLLSKCDLLVHSYFSNVSTAILYFNPLLPFITVYSD